MGQVGRPTAQIVLSDAERETLERWARRPKTGQGLALRCRIVLAASTGITNQQIARELSCNAVTVGKWRTRFAEKRFGGLLDEPRPGQPRKVTDEIVEAVIVATLETTPDDGSTQWSTRSMAAKVGLNQTAISRIWRTFGLKPHRIEDFKLSTDPQFIDKVRRRRDGHFARLGGTFRSGSRAFSSGVLRKRRAVLDGHGEERSEAARFGEAQDLAEEPRRRRRVARLDDGV